MTERQRRDRIHFAIGYASGVVGDKERGEHLSQDREVMVTLYETLQCAKSALNAIVKNTDEILGDLEVL